MHIRTHLFKYLTIKHILSLLTTLPPTKILLQTGGLLIKDQIFLANW